MKYGIVTPAHFVIRPNRFIAHVNIDGNDEIVHVKNTGRCKEILQGGTKVILEASNNPNRKTKYSLIAAYKDDVLINIDSQVPNVVVYESIKAGFVKELVGTVKLKREVSYKNSRFDLYFETDSQKGFIEIKGVTYEANGIAMFPDAPTERGVRHVYEMIHAVENGYSGFIFFLIQLKGVNYFTPYEAMDPSFSKALKLAHQSSVVILAYDSIVTEDGIALGSPVEVRF